MRKPARFFTISLTGSAVLGVALATCCAMIGGPKLPLSLVAMIAALGLGMSLFCATMWFIVSRIEEERRQRNEELSEIYRHLDGFYDELNTQESWGTRIHNETAECLNSFVGRHNETLQRLEKLEAAMRRTYLELPPFPSNSGNSTVN